MPTSILYLFFLHRFMQKALNGTSNGKGYNHISTSYPSLEVTSSEDLGQWSFGGTMAGWAALSVTKYNFHFKNTFFLTQARVKKFSMDG